MPPQKQMWRVQESNKGARLKVHTITAKHNFMMLLTIDFKKKSAQNGSQLYNNKY